MGGGCGCTHHKMVPLFIIIIGVIFLLGATGNITMQWVNILWPIALILLGLQKMVGGMCKCCGMNNMKK
jgi:hypothetical protein